MVELYEFIRNCARMLESYERREFIAGLEREKTLASSGTFEPSEHYAFLWNWKQELTPNEIYLLAQDLRSVTPSGAVPDHAGLPPGPARLPPIEDVAPRHEAGNRALPRGGATVALEVGFATCERLEAIAKRTGLSLMRLCISEGGGLDAQVDRMNEDRYAGWFATQTAAVGPEWGYFNWRLSPVWQDRGTSAPGVTVLRDHMVSRSLEPKEAQEVEQLLRAATISREARRFSETEEGRRMCKAASIGGLYLERYTHQRGSRPCRAEGIMMFDPATDVPRIVNLFSRLVSRTDPTDQE